MAVGDFFKMFTLMTSFFPPWFVILIAILMGIMVLFILFKVVAFVMDVLPFV